MANYTTGNIWDTVGKSNHVLVITTNNIITKGKLVMGAGVALEAKQKFPVLPYYLANEIEYSGRDYYFVTTLVSFGDSEVEIGALQTKRHWRDKSSLTLVDNSIYCMQQFANNHPRLILDCVMPGIGFGGLSYDAVKIITDECPNNVIFWRR